MALNVMQHTSLAVASTWVVGLLHPGFSPGTGENLPTVKIPNFPLLKARGAHFVFHWYDHLASLFIPSVDLEDVIAHTEALTKFTQEALNDSQQSLSLLSTEMSLTRNAALQKRMALDIITASQGGTYAIIQTEYCVLIPGESANIHTTFY